MTQTSQRDWRQVTLLLAAAALCGGCGPTAAPNDAVDLRVSPAIQGDSIVLSGLDGFFAADEEVGSPLYLCARTTTGQIGVLVSNDNGETWHDFALSDYVVPVDRSLYAVGGSRRLTPDGWLIGSFTEQNLTGPPHQVYFLRVKVR